MGEDSVLTDKCIVDQLERMVYESRASGNVV